MNPAVRRDSFSVHQPPFGHTEQIVCHDHAASIHRSTCIFIWSSSPIACSTRATMSSADPADDLKAQQSVVGSNGAQNKTEKHAEVNMTTEKVGHEIQANLAAPSLWTRILDSLPPWVSTNLRSRRSWKLVVRCWAASWICFVILLPEKSLKTLGNT